MSLSNDKEHFVCLNCHAIGPLDNNLRCLRCDSDSVISVERLKNIETQKDVVFLNTQKLERKPLRWWHFVCGSFETYVSNYRCTSLEEARHQVCHDNWEWTAKGDVFVEDSVEELSNEDYQRQWRDSNAKKSEYYQHEEPCKPLQAKDLQQPSESTT